MLIPLTGRNQEQFFINPDQVRYVHFESKGKESSLQLTKIIFDDIDQPLYVIETPAEIQAIVDEAESPGMS